MPRETVYPSHNTRELLRHAVEAPRRIHERPRKDIDGRAGGGQDEDRALDPTGRFE
ncbi:MAG: hypothetical protein JOZ96_18330 [Acidobacteria bacterium]|nr:hypothetical protein [Acidobacteriota bacterium]